MTLEDALFETSEHDEPTDDILTDDLSPPRRSLGPDPSLHPEDWAIPGTRPRCSASPAWCSPPSACGPRPGPSSSCG